MKKVLTYGTFDLFHLGHVRLLERLHRLGDKLIVGCSTDEFNALKGKTSVYTYEERATILRACRYVDEVIPENDWDQKQHDIKKYAIDVFAMGDDWSGKFDELSAFTEVYYLPRTEGVSTTATKNIITNAQEQKKLQMKNALETLRDLIDKS
jgi:glycerol-3-phosphate cytidylyltransferase